ncbi:MAG TPA: hypothetical protein PLI52_03220 [Prochlorococcaceae cyanobacterium AMR_MDS_5431]|nr:hypothetical protein [Prochlorococcaceae cyanobacterium AMR_MDS_5431]
MILEFGFSRTRWLTPMFRTAVRFRSAPLQGAAMVSTGHEEGY